MAPAYPVPPTPPWPTAIIDCVMWYPSPWMFDELGCRNAVRRSIWYCLMTGTPSPGMIENTIASVTTKASPSHAKCRHGAPSTNSMPSVTAAYTSAVPKSGSANTSSAGSAM